MIEYSRFDDLLVQAIVKSIHATEDLDRRRSNKFTQKERIGNFTTFLRRETVNFIADYLSSNSLPYLRETDKCDLGRWLSRFTSTSYWLDVASPDYEHTRHYRSPFTLIVSENQTKIMDAQKMKTLCDLAKEKVSFSPSSLLTPSSLSPQEETSIDNFPFRLQNIIDSANRSVAEANLIASKAGTILSTFSSPANTP